MEHSFQESLFRPLPSVEELRDALAASEGNEVRIVLDNLFDENTFVELGVYAKRSFCEYAQTSRTNEFEGLVCGYGAISGVLVYVFAQDFSRMKGAVDETHAKKICEIYRLAMKNGAPVIGIFNSAGADVYEGVSAMAAYGRMMKASAKASGVIPQIALITGKCIGTCAAFAAMFDFAVVLENAEFYVVPPAYGDGGEDESALCAVRTPDLNGGVSAVRKLLYYLPSAAGDGVSVEQPSDDIGRLLGELDFRNDARTLLSAVADNGIWTEVFAGHSFELTTAFTTIGGVNCGVLAICSASGGRLSAAAARKAARFVSFLDAFSMPLVTFVDSEGFSDDSTGQSVPIAAEFARLATAFALSDMPKITVIVGHAIGGAFTLLGSKALGADLAYAIDTAEIGTLSHKAAVAFAWNDRISEDTTRETLEENWLRSMSSPVAAASTGEIDDIINMDELRKRLCSGLLMLTCRADARRKHAVMPL